MSFESGISPAPTTGIPGSVVIKAIKAAGAIVHMEPWDFKQILAQAEHPVVVKAKAGFFKPYYQYLTTYKGFVLFTRSRQELAFAENTEFIAAREIWVPE